MYKIAVYWDRKFVYNIYMYLHCVCLDNLYNIVCTSLCATILQRKKTLIFVQFCISLQ